jgi:uncharacterized protein with ParB-like and HNH nuclease domain
MYNLVMIKPDDDDLENLLTKSDRKYAIPVYQRNFDWGKGELQELLDDLTEIMTSDGNSLFLGNLIFDISIKNEYQIVDGQQRLTTISLIAVAIREHAKKINEHTYAGEMQKYITNKSIWSDDNSNRIKVAPNIRDVFEYISKSDWDGTFPDIIGATPVKRQVNKIQPIYNHILKSLEKYNINDLMKFTKALMTAYVVVIQVENTNDVFSIFERTNARGLDLNIGDLLKNLILSYGSDEYNEQWTQIMLNADNSIPKMLKYFWVYRSGNIRQSDLYKSLKARARADGVDVFIDDLYDFSKFYSAIKSADELKLSEWLIEFGLETLAKNEDSLRRINRTFQALKLFRVTQAYTVIYSLFILFNRQKTSANKDRLIASLEAIEKYHFVNNVIANRIGNDVETYYSEKASEIFSSEESFGSEVNTLIDELRKKKASKQEFVASFVETITYDTKNLSLLAYYFDRTNNFKSKGAQIIPLFTPEKIGTKRDYNIDHILPQAFKDEYDKENQEIFDRIGNLILIPRHSNSGFQDMPPHEKKAAMLEDKKHTGNLRYLDDFLKIYDKLLEKWDIQAIHKRSKDLANDSYDRIWQF